MKMPDDIKKGLEVCSADECQECPYYYDMMCMQIICRDALALIQQLEAERDAAV